MRKNCKLRTNEKKSWKKQKIEKVEKLKNQSWKNKVEIWQIEKLQTIVSNENLKRKITI